MSMDGDSEEMSEEQYLMMIESGRDGGGGDGWGDGATEQRKRRIQMWFFFLSLASLSDSDEKIGTESTDLIIRLPDNFSFSFSCFFNFFCSLAHTSKNKMKNSDIY